MLKKIENGKSTTPMILTKHWKQLSIKNDYVSFLRWLF